jgi:hypothetical protein
VLLLALVSCARAGQSTISRTSDHEVPESVAELKRTPSQVEFHGIVVALTTSLWVNVGPTMPTRPGAPLINGIVTAVATEGTLAGKGIRIDHVWLVQGTQVWEVSEPEEQDQADPSFTDSNGVPRNQPNSPGFSVALRNGPAWDSGVAVDVVARLVDATGEAKKVRAPAQPIGRVQ